ncbi:hypothetical protein BH11PLA2_BH11PLA2_06270 [soil metagenome]
MLAITIALILAQPKTPAGPTLATPVTLGAKAGSKSTLTLKGTKLDKLSEVWLGTQKIPTTNIITKADQATVTLELPKGLAVGVHALRVVTPEGISNLRPFTIDDLAEVPAAKGRNKKETAQVLEGLCTVAATTTADTSDWYKFSVKAGERWTFEVVGRRLGSPIDPVIMLYDAKSGREMPGLYADDTIGLQTDCRLTHTFKADAEVLIEVRDTTYRGGSDYGYRLRVGDFPSCLCALPLRVSAPTTLMRWNSNDSDPLQGFLATFDQDWLLSPQRVSGGVRGWGLPVVRSPLPESFEVEPNDDYRSGDNYPLPWAITGIFQKKSDRDCFAVMLKKGEKVSFIAEAAEHNAPTEVLLKVLDHAGKELATSNPEKVPATIEFTAPAEGKFIVQAEQLNYVWGPNEVYRLVAKPMLPDAVVMLGSDRVTLPGKIAITNVTRQYGYDGPIEVKWAGDGVKGSATIPAKTTPTAAAPFLLNLEATANAKPGVIDGRIVSEVKGRNAVTASTLEPLKAAFPGLTNPPPEMNGIVYVLIPSK